MTSLKNILILSVLASSVSIMGCNSDLGSNSSGTQSNSQQNNTGGSSSTTNLSQALQAHKWKLLNAKDANNNTMTVLTSIDKRKTNLNFQNSQTFSFGVGCNSFSGQYQLSSTNALTTTGIFGTQTVCNALDAAEKKLAQLLGQQSQITITQAGTNNVLTMTMADGSKLLWERRADLSYPKSNEVIAANLKKYDWKLKRTFQHPSNPDQSSLDPISELEAVKNKVKVSFKGNNTLVYEAGCNKHNATFGLTNDANLKLTNVIATTTVCNNTTQAAETKLNQIMQQDTKIVMILGEVPVFSQSTLTTSGAATGIEWEAVAKTTINLTAIDQYNWKLTDARKQNSPADSVLQAIPELIAAKDTTTLNFSFTSPEISSTQYDKISYSAGCNDFRGDFTINQTDVLSVSQIQMTEKACANPTASAETMLNNIMQKGGKLEVAMENNVPKLTFTTGNANAAFETLTWQGTAK